MSKQKFASVWDAIEDTADEAENMKLRSELMIALKAHIARAGLNSGLLRGKINQFGLDALVNMLAKAGMHVEMRVLESA